jgi:hypothetical protein
VAGSARGSRRAGPQLARLSCVQGGQGRPGWADWVDFGPRADFK